MDHTATAASDRLQDGHRQAEQAIRRLRDVVDGIRVLRRTAGRWLMTHQHVSFTMDPTTGLAATELTP